MLTQEDKEYIVGVHKILDDMEKLGVSEKSMNNFIRQERNAFDYEPDQNFKYTGSQE
tara:strand:- start:103 stop:273 length:171 start_codon:yes stop_codon:yes gene_type:complete